MVHGHNGCILSKFYIKPQRRQHRWCRHNVVSYRNSTSNHNVANTPIARFLVVSYRNSTSNHNNASLLAVRLIVVSYRNSTSNHNDSPIAVILQSVVSYRNSTSNHNWSRAESARTALYLIEILHQTTTKTFATRLSNRCILSKFYIKPQPTTINTGSLIVVSYRNSTSNHNRSASHTAPTEVVSYRNSTSNHNLFTINCQRFSVVSYRNSTSNHNYLAPFRKMRVLYLIEILHQTTTKAPSLPHSLQLYLIEILHQTTTIADCPPWNSRLYLIEILHQTTTATFFICCSVSCILSKFYIKPQQ